MMLQMRRSRTRRFLAEAKKAKKKQGKSPARESLSAP
jgi:hypothetical protein